jgi:hypothetical protein
MNSASLSDNSAPVSLRGVLFPLIILPKFTAKFYNRRRDVNPWSALRAEFSRNENRRDGFPEPRNGVGMKRKGLRQQPECIRREFRLSKPYHFYFEYVIL